MGEPKAAMYLGKDVFISLDTFESSLSPLSIPEELETKEAVVSAFAFVHKDGVSMVANGQVYMYFKSLNRWVHQQEFTSPMSELSNTHYCYARADPQCKECSWTLFAYDTRRSVSDSHIFLSQDGGYTFTHTLTSGICDGEMSIVTVDIPHNPVGCTDVAPLIALVAVSCPPTRHIRIVKNTTACDKGLIQEAALANNFGYTISHNIYISHFLARKHIQQDNRQVKYNFTNLGCPLLAYYKKFLGVSIFELWENNRFQEHVPAEFVLFEIHGMHNYDYLLTAHDANSISQPQNWSSLLEEQESPDPNTAWTRRNYMSCKDRNGPELKQPSVKYQVLEGDKNKIIFPPYNVLYILKAIVVDTFYSYCDLSVTFSVYVYGAFPRNYLHFWASLTVFLILLLIFKRYSLSHLSF
ncbi:PREDICTED: cation channel sperm-associated protein subunit delta [Fulmarus glacialis]|uniref:cation channel sperm-associated protein subunit delta n=1 Tax=Fulmarus glacialis TaxID=30455 RepID=UPI00051C8F14|nr:PREDICTED: cation channel sperm-associated protein subunit delta [Fulmarus glacialis]